MSALVWIVICFACLLTGFVVGVLIDDEESPVARVIAGLLTVIVALIVGPFAWLRNKLRGEAVVDRIARNDRRDRRPEQGPDHRVRLLHN